MTKPIVNTVTERRDPGCHLAIFQVSPSVISVDYNLLSYYWQASVIFIDNFLLFFTTMQMLLKIRQEPNQSVLQVKFGIYNHYLAS